MQSFFKITTNVGTQPTWMHWLTVGRHIDDAYRDGTSIAPGNVCEGPGHKKNSEDMSSTEGRGSDRPAGCPHFF